MLFTPVGGANGGKEKLQALIPASDADGSQQTEESYSSLTAGGGSTAKSETALSVANKRSLSLGLRNLSTEIFATADCRAPVNVSIAVEEDVLQMGGQGVNDSVEFSCSDVMTLLVSLTAIVIGALIGNFLELRIVLMLAFCLQWLVFLPSAYYQTEKLYDLTGSVTYIVCLTTSITVVAQHHHVRQVVNSILGIVWALRLGLFLFRRILRDGSDSRFTEVKRRPLRFFNFWSVQGLWVLLTALPIYVLCVQDQDKPIQWSDYLGWSLWLIGFSVEVIADYQKSAFKSLPENKDNFITTGLWRYSRHPNYFGEITLWIGMFCTCATVFMGIQWLAILSPLFVLFLLTCVSGIPMLEKASEERWGTNPEYIRYKSTTSILVPWFKLSHKDIETTEMSAAMV